ncbi:unnamed protein product [Choristocarpus tenellus]
MATNFDSSVGMGDSSSWYAARMVYLVEDDDPNSNFGNASLIDPMSRTLKPPTLFMSRRQARADAVLSSRNSVSTKYGKKGGDPLRGVRVQTGEKTLGTRRNDVANRISKSKSDRRQQVQEVDNNDNPASWRAVKEAGVAFWVNDTTGIATDVCPHESLRHPCDMANKEGLTNNGEKGALRLGLGEGTGALVYDSSEYEEAMRILDGKIKSPALVAGVTR